MKLLLSLLLLAAAVSGCQTSITDAKTPKRNNGASNYANLANENQARDRIRLQHGNADRP